MNSILLLTICALAFGTGNAAPKRDMEEVPDLFEGDIILPLGAQNAIIGEEYLWPQGTVAYALDINFTPDEIQKIMAGWAEISNTTCIKFRQRLPGESDYVFIQKGVEGSGCFSAVGRQGGQQILNLATPTCTNRHGTVIHEMLHTLGFYHEQSRPDRDDFVEIMYNKIEPGKEHNFRKYETDTVDTLGAPYDYDSVLHYSAYGFSIDGSPTIVPIIPGVVIGQRLKISEIDAGKVRIMYNCPDPLTN